MRNKKTAKDYQPRQSGKRWLTSWAIFFLLACLVFGRQVAAQEAFIEGMAVNTSERHLLFFCTLQHGFTPEMETGIQNGIPATFNFEVRLKPAGGKGKEAPGISKTFSRTLTFDTLKEEYQVQRSEKGTSVLRVRDLVAAKRLMTEIAGFKVAPLQFLEPGARYIVEIRASLTKKTLPLNVHYLIPFWKAWDVETGWFSLVFRYDPAKDS